MTTEVSPPRSRAEIARDNILTVQRALSERLERGYARETLIREDDPVYTPDFQRFGPARDACGGDPSRPTGRELFAAFDDVTVTYSKMEARDDRVITYFTISGVQTATYFNHPPRGERMTADGVLMHRLRHGRIAEEWAVLRWR